MLFFASSLCFCLFGIFLFYEAIKEIRTLKLGVTDFEGCNSGGKTLTFY